MRSRKISLTLLLALAAAIPAQAKLPAEAEPATPAPTTAPAGTINLDLQGVDAEEAFSSLAKQTDVTFSVRDPKLWQTADPVFLTVRDAMFWPTFLDLCRQARFSFNPDSNEDRGGAIRLVPEVQGIKLGLLKPIEARGLLLVPRSAQRNTSLSYDRPDATTATCTIQVVVLPDPSLAVSQIGPVTVTEAVDENGLSLVLPKTANPSYYTPNSGGVARAQTLSIALANPKGAGKKVARLKGYVRLMAATGLETLQIDSPLKAQALTKQLPDFDVTLQPLTLLSAKPVGPADGGAATYQLKLSFHIKNRPSPAPGLRRGADRSVWSLIQGISLTDAQGRRYMPMASAPRTSADTQDGEVTFRCDPISPAGEPAKLTWKLPLGQRAAAIPFELTDLPLP